MIPTFIFYIVSFLSLICVSIIIIVSSFFLSIQSIQYIGKTWILFILGSLKVLCGISWHVSGVDNIPTTPFVMVSNHQGPWESLFLQTLFIPVSSIMKKEILIIPFFGWAISRLRPISINRKLKMESSKKVIEVGGQRIRDGFSVLIFPEGTRRRPDEGIGRFGRSCGVLASNESVPIIPICHNSGKYWINRSYKKKGGEIKIVIGEPIFGSDPKVLTKKARHWVDKTYLKIS